MTLDEIQLNTNHSHVKKGAAVYAGQQQSTHALDIKMFESLTF